LKSVGDYFQAHPQGGRVLSDTIVVGEQGDYFCHRPSLVPLRHQIWIRFPVLTCAVFIRRRRWRIWTYFDTKWRDLGTFWMLDLLKRGVRMRVLRRFTSVFTETGET